jgi:hypothetical protein
MHGWLILTIRTTLIASFSSFLATLPLSGLGDEGDSDQLLRLGQFDDVYPFQLYASADLYNLPNSPQLAIIWLADQPAPGEIPPPAGSLRLIPRFATEQGETPLVDAPHWSGDAWAQATPVVVNARTVTPVQVLDDLLRYLARRPQFPALQRIVLLGQGRGAQLLDRYNKKDPLSRTFSGRDMTLLSCTVPKDRSLEQALEQVQHKLIKNCLVYHTSSI